MKKKDVSVGVKFSVITFFVYLALISFVILVSHKRSLQNFYDQYSAIGKELIEMAADEINVDHIKDYLSGSYDKQEYDDTLSRLNRYTRFRKEIMYLYVYKINEGNDATATVVFDTYTDHAGLDEGLDGEGDKLGDIYELDPAFADELPRLQRGEYLDPVVDNTKYGYLMTCSKPLYGSDHTCQGYIFVDFDLTPVKKSNIEFTLKLFAVSFIFMLLLLTLGIIAVSVRITKPIEKMYACISGFKYETDTDRKNNLDSLKSLNIHTNIEIESLYEAIIKSYEESYNYMTEYKIATKKLGVAKEMAYLDSLTGINNKTAFDDITKKYQEKINNREIDGFTVIMADINNLKYINDTFGHKAGDEYIKGCCNILSAACQYSEVYRIGGDEFIIILQGKDLEECETIFANLTDTFDKAYCNRETEPYHRYSAAIGMASLREGDTNINDIVKRADSEMYVAKSKFKTKYGSYR